LFGNFSQIAIQGIGVGVTVAYSLLVTFLIVWLLDRSLGLRVAPEAEQSGLDLTVHLESGYKIEA
jgi:Amt family ammonium transporter